MPGSRLRRVFGCSVIGVRVADGLCAMRELFLVVLVAATALGACVPAANGRVHTSPPETIGRKTNFVPAPEVTGARLATDRAIKIEDEQAKGMSALGGVKLGVLSVRVIERIDPVSGEWSERVVWPGASIDAAALGATHARTLSVEAPRVSTTSVCGGPRAAGCGNNVLTGAVTASYELWHVPSDRWTELPEALRPNPIADTAIRDVQPGNWVRPPPVVKVTNP
jgi:hypothetical protein